ncbi:hypothetical protein GCK72_003073 [Caenorhabditis remanei]|uniref:Tyrosine-protein phosphatase domain-containing protein n=1 Tax=Caenorhabditis remanei TaxID=31234 RepID=A0A6A5HXK4_CAERE|nr:hypothetical protein GCK72_003073 [Caenorhabditis remanei]KAF1771247.1 hypothetical protein GCK72_003073 [Caenorhabditis remanei]
MDRILFRMEIKMRSTAILVHPRIVTDSKETPVAKNLKTHVTNLKKVARVTNGIYLLRELIAGSIDSDELISEILRFGDVKPSKISEIVLPDVQSAVNDMKSLSDQLAASENAKKVERAFEGLKEILNEVDGIGNLTEWTDEKEHFGKEIDRLAKDGLNITDVGSINSACFDWRTNYQQLKGNTVSTKDIQETVRLLKKMKDASMNLNNSPIFWKFSNFSFATDGISPILKAEKGVAMYRSHVDFLHIDASDGSLYTNETELMSKKLSSMVDRLTDIKTVSSLMISRGRPKRQLQHTFGLPDGASDLSFISSDIVDSWIAKVVKSESLKIALTHLDGLTSISKSVDDSLGSDFGGIIDFLSHLDLMSEVSKEVDAAKTGVSQGYNCSLIAGPPIANDSIQIFKNAVDEIDKKLLELNTERDELLKYVKSSGIIGICDDILAICNKTKADGSNVQEVVNEIKGYKNLDVMAGHIKQLYDLTHSIIGLNKVQNDATTVNSSIDSLNKYHKEISKTYSDYFKCLQDRDQLSLVIKAIEGLKRIRNWKQDSKYSKTLMDGFNVVQKVVGIKDGLNEMKRSIEGLVDLKTPETDALKDFPEASTHLEVIGKAVQGLTGMRDALNEKDDMMKFSKSIEVVERKKNEATDVASLDELVKLHADIQNMFDSLSDFEGTLSWFADSDSLAEQSDIFSNAKKVSGITGNFSSMGKAVEELKSVVNGSDLTSLKEVEEGLKMMDTLELDFAGFHKSFDDSKNSLTALDLFFAKTQKKFEPTTPIPAQRPTFDLETSTEGIEDSGAQLGAEKDEKDSEKSDDLTKVYIGVGALCFVAFVIFLLYKFKRPWLKAKCPCLCWKKDKLPSPQPRRPKPSKPEEFLKIFVDYLMEQFNEIRVAKKASDEDITFFTYEFYKTSLEAHKVTVDETKIMPLVLTDCRGDTRLIRGHFPFLNGTMERFPNTFIHANFLVFPTKRKWLLTLAPQKAAEAIPESDGKKAVDKKNSTIGKFWWLAKQFNSQHVAQLCKLDEANEIQCDQYYPLKVDEEFTDGCLTLKCTHMRTDYKGQLEVRTITATFTNEPPFTVTHYVFTRWADPTYPSSLDPLIAIYRALNKDTGTPIVLCSDGYKRTGMFALGAYMADYVRKHRTIDFKKCYQSVASLRLGAIPFMTDYAFSGRLCLEMLADEATTTSALRNDYNKLRDGWDRIDEEHEKRNPKKEAKSESTTQKTSTTQKSKKDGNDEEYLDDPTIRSR